MLVHRFAAIAAALGLALAACSKTEEPKKAAAAPPPASAPAKPLREADFQAGGVKVALLELKRTSSGVTARWQYRNETDGEVKAALGHGVGSDNYRPARQAYLLDNASKTKYPVAESSDGKLVAAEHGDLVHSFKLKPKQVLNTWATFAVPAGARQLTLVVAGTPPFDDVPLD